MKCPVCKSSISELDEICPVCKTNLEEYERDNKVEYITNDDYTDKYNNYHKNNIGGTRANTLSMLAKINLVISFISSIVVWIAFSTVEIMGDYDYILKKYETTTVTNWYAIFGGIGIIFMGILIYYTLMTIVDIFEKVDK